MKRSTDMEISPLSVKVRLEPPPDDKVKHTKQGETDHNVLLTDQNSGQIYYQFRKIMDGEEKFEFHSTKGYGVLYTSHALLLS